MRNRCQKLRDEALAHGLDKKAGEIWKIHSRTCTECRTELFILESLEQQERDDRQHLASGEIAILLEAVEENSYKKHPKSNKTFKTVINWGSKIAAIFVIAFSVSHFLDSDKTGKEKQNTPATASTKSVAKPSEAGLQVASPGMINEPVFQSKLDSHLLNIKKRISNKSTNLSLDQSLTWGDKPLGTSQSSDDENF